MILIYGLVWNEEAAGMMYANFIECSELESRCRVAELMKKKGFRLAVSVDENGNILNHAIHKSVPIWHELSATEPNPGDKVVIRDERNFFSTNWFLGSFDSHCNECKTVHRQLHFSTEDTPMAGRIGGVRFAICMEKLHSVWHWARYCDVINATKVVKP